MHIRYTKILSKVLLTSDAGEFHPQKYNIHLLVGRGDPAGACSSVLPPRCSYDNSSTASGCLLYVPTHIRLTQVKRRCSV